MIKVSQLLSRKNHPIITIEPGATVLQALEKMAENNIGSLVVIDNGKYTGIITERDYSRKVVLKGKISTTALVGEIMSTNLPTLSPGDSTDHCMELMSDKNVRYMPVFDKGDLVGIISMSDVVKAMISSQRETIEQLQTYISS